MIGVIIVLISIYMYVFSEWAITPVQGFMLVVAAAIELTIEGGVVFWAAQCYLEKRKQEK